MDRMTIHLAGLRRRSPSDLPVASIGHVPRKTDIIRSTFQTCNFSFVLAGAGFYEHHGVRHEVRPPAVVRQWPGEPMHYGPPAGGWWQELYLIYPPACREALTRRGYLRDDRPLWAIGDTARVQRALDELQALAEDVEGNVDRIDRVCDLLILESLAAAGPRPTSGPEEAVRAVRRLLESRPLEEHDLGRLARDHGLSPTHFRRLWQRRYGTPPHRFLVENRLRLACRALVESDAAITTVALTHGFGDPLYFSRRFRAFTGESPGAYRVRYRTSLRI